MPLSRVFQNTVEYVDHMGSDLLTVNSARVSYQKESKEWNDKDKGLVNYLARHKHYSPFRHGHISLRIKMPRSIAMQMYKHIVGIEISVAPVKDHAWNELSQRYKVIDEIFFPQVWREQHKTSKQCSAGDLKEQKEAMDIYEKAMTEMHECYDKLIKLGVAKEQARMVLPMSSMTEVIWTASLQAVHNFLVLRDAPDAQHEIRDIAEKIRVIVEEKFPNSLKALERDYKKEELINLEQKHQSELENLKKFHNERENQLKEDLNKTVEKFETDRLKMELELDKVHTQILDLKEQLLKFIPKS